MHIVLGWTVVVVNLKPKGVSSCISLVSALSRSRHSNGGGKLFTWGPSTAVIAVANASHATMTESSWISDLTSRALTDLERSWLSLARRQGWLETWTLGGTEAIVGAEEEWRDLARMSIVRDGYGRDRR